jgi:hypothetical protein
VNRFAVFLQAVRASRWPDIRDIALAQLALLRAQVIQWTVAPGRLVDVETPSFIYPSPSTKDSRKGMRLADAVDRAARYGVFRPQCLARALALSRMLDANGISGHRIRVGVRKVDDHFMAHAWVELGDMILGDPSVNTSIYTPLTDVSLGRSRGRSGRAWSRGSATGEQVSWTQ